MTKLPSELLDELLGCPFCGKPAYVSDPDVPSHGWEIGCPDNWGFKRGNIGHCSVAPAATGMDYAETIAAWNRRPTTPIDTEETEPVALQSRVWLSDQEKWGEWTLEAKPLAPQFPQLRIEDRPLFASPSQVRVTEEMVEKMARLLCQATLHTSWDGLQEGRITDRGFQPFAYNNDGGWHFQGGHEDIRDIVRSLLSALDTASAQGEGE